MEEYTMSLTVREKEHWKSRISTRIDRAIESLCAKNDPGLLERICSQAKQEAVQSLGIAEHQAVLEQIEKDKKTLERKERETRVAIVATVTGTPAEDVHYAPYCNHQVSDAIKRRQSLHEEELLAADPIGKKILNLRREKDDLLDTIWLATSPKQVKELWHNVTHLLEQPPTQLQKQALEFDPMDSKREC
jgi:hypothetical protein